MNRYHCLVKDVPAFPKVATYNNTSFTLHQDTVKITPRHCKHMGAPLCVNSVFTAKCNIHGVINNMTRANVQNGNFVVDIENYQIQLPDISQAHEFSAVTTQGNFTRQMWLENTMDLDHVEHVHRSGFADVVLDTKKVEHVLLNNGYSMSIVGVKEDSIRGLNKLTEIKSKTFTHYFVAENLSVTSFCGVLFSVEKIQDHFIETRFFCNSDLENKEAFLSLIDSQNKIILKEDAAMLSSLNQESYYYGQFKTTDERIAWYRKHANL